MLKGYWCDIRQCAVDEPYHLSEYKSLLEAYEIYLNETTKENILSDVDKAYRVDMGLHDDDVIDFIWPETESINVSV